MSQNRLKKGATKLTSNQGLALPNKRLLLFWIVLIFWLLLDQSTKLLLESVGEFGLTNTYFGLDGIFRFSLIHNTGAAWGIFSGYPLILGIVSVVISAIMMIYALIWGKYSNNLQMVALGLICAGGIGNAIDRFLHGYVIDFINVIFIDFPVFNIADIGVTCGVILFIIGVIIEWVNESKSK